MKNRLEAARNLLASDGSIFIQLDYNQLHTTKVLMDDIFGKENFRNEIVWQRTTNTGSSKGMAQNLSNDTDSILYYTKSKNNIFNKQYKPYSENYLKRFKYQDKNGKYRWQYMATYSEEKLKQLQKLDMIRWDDKNKNPEYKQYLHELKGIPLSNLWTDIFHINPMAIESTGFKTQKPEELLARIIKLASNESDIVLDFFTGSGTTCAVSHKLGRQFIGIEQLDYVNEFPLKRLSETIKGKNTNTLQEIDWKGGGSFVYAELAENAASYISKIEALKSNKEAIALWNELKEEPFISYRVSPAEFDANIDSFEQLALDDQKKLLISTIDKNHLYISYADIEDKTYTISDADKRLNRDFYKM